jgi:hypothetical protein
MGVWADGGGWWWSEDTTMIDEIQKTGGQQPHSADGMARQPHQPPPLTSLSAGAKTSSMLSFSRCSCPAPQ